ncbi:hypothetical protein C8R44DRAFT_535567, partial [Mycena epipterygia]
NPHVSRLNHKIDTRGLEAAFAKIGRVQRRKHLSRSHTHESRGFRFVTSETADAAAAGDAPRRALRGGGEDVNVE